jgi:ubiquinone biosynthesis protein COQ9
MGEVTRDAIVDAALQLAQARSWEALRLHQVAAQLGAGLEDIRRHFREKEELVDAWFDRADRAMLLAPQTSGWYELDAPERLRRPLLAWLAALAPYRRVTREMLLGRMEFGHVHFHVAGVLRISRTVQWWREASGCSTVLPRRALDETAMTAIYLAVLTRWLWDESEDAAPTAALLDGLLRRCGVRIDAGVDVT